MRVFTPRHQRVLKALMRVAEQQAEHAAYRWTRPLDMRLIGLTALLVQKGVVSDEEIDAALKEAEAGRAVDEALDPELQAAYEELERCVTAIDAQKKPKRPPRKQERSYNRRRKPQR